MLTTELDRSTPCINISYNLQIYALPVWHLQLPLWPSEIAFILLLISQFSLYLNTQFSPFRFSHSYNNKTVLSIFPKLASEQLVLQCFLLSMKRPLISYYYICIVCTDPYRTSLVYTVGLTEHAIIVFRIINFHKKKSIHNASAKEIVLKYLLKVCPNFVDLNINHHSYTLYLKNIKICPSPILHSTPLPMNYLISYVLSATI